MLNNRNKFMVSYGLALLLSIFNVMHGMDLPIMPEKRELGFTIILEHGPVFFDHVATCNLALVSKKIEESIKKGAGQRQEYVQEYFSKVSFLRGGYCTWHPHGTACCNREAYKDGNESYFNLSSHFLKDGNVDSIDPDGWCDTFEGWALKAHKIRFGHQGDMSVYVLDNKQRFVKFWGRPQQIIECSLLSNGSLRKLQCGLQVVDGGGIACNYGLSEVAFFPALLKSCLHSSVDTEDGLIKVYKLKDAIIPDNYKETAAGCPSKVSFEKLPADIKFAIEERYKTQQIKK